MKYIILIVFSTYLLQIYSNKAYKYKETNYLKPTLSEKIYKSETRKTLLSILSGDKSYISNTTKKVFREYGIIHLLTPSGLHLSSLFFINFKNYFFLGLYILIFAYISKYESYYSMERVLIFKIISHFSRFKLEHNFICTFLVSLLIGHLTANPLSFIYSLIFWGTIIIFKNNWLKVIFFLNITLLISSSLSNISVRPLSIIVNPIVTFLTTFLFPLLTFNQFFQFKLIHNVLNYYYSLLFDTLFYIYKIDPFVILEVSTTYLIISAFFFMNSKYKMGLFVLLMNSNNLGMKSEYLVKNKVINLGPKEEVLKKKNDRIHFIDQVCLIRVLKISCKKKPSNYGGPII